MSFLSVITLANSIIGVAILSMPYCFKQCGIILAIVMILCSGMLVKASCILNNHLALKNIIFVCSGYMSSSSKVCVTGKAEKF